MIVLSQFNPIHITGRGLVLVVSLRANGLSVEQLSVGGLVIANQIRYEITGIEGARQLNDIADTIGLLVRPATNA